MLAEIEFDTQALPRKSYAVLVIDVDARKFDYDAD
jgi:hypothetical protein